MLDHSYYVQQVQQAWLSLQQQQPLIQYITNSVAANYTANIVLACGASPALIDHPLEAAAFTQVAQALIINTGTPTLEQVQAMQLAAQAAQQHGRPWILDPVGYGSALAWRSSIVDQLLAFQPSIIRGNASEISTLAGNSGLAKGVDSTLNSADVYQHTLQLWQHTACIAISGESDFIVSREYNCVIQVKGGSAMQPKITAMGCALGALIAAYSAVTSPTLAAIAAHVHFAIAAQLAAAYATGIGQFNVAFLDELAQMNSEKIEQYMAIELFDLAHLNVCIHSSN